MSSNNNKLPGRLYERRVPIKTGKYVPTMFERDRARITHCSSFRKLQAKTQVLGIGEGDFHRTRLTHSLEVAQIGRGIVAVLHRKYKQDKEIYRWLPGANCIESICLAHDLGHPPFGHAGERTLDFFMQSHGGFEGNGQTLRIITKLESHTEGEGLCLTRRTLLGVLKYPAPYSDVTGKSVRSVKRQRPFRGWEPPKCYLDSEDQLVKNWLLSSFSLSDQKLFQEFSPPGDRMIKGTKCKSNNGKPKFKTLDCSIMELADDIAYSCHDFEDGIALQLIRKEDVEGSLEEFLVEMSGNLIFIEDIFSGCGHRRKRAIGQLIHALIISIEILDQNTIFENPIFRFQAQFPGHIRPGLKMLQKKVFKLMIEKPEVRSLEWRGQEILSKLFDALSNYPNELIPAKHLKETDETNPYRQVCDYIAGMSDEYAIRAYERLFVPRQRSIFDRM
jgi:dGTPase